MTKEKIKTTYMHLCKRGMESEYIARHPGTKYVPSTCNWCPFDDNGIRSEVLGFYIKDHRTYTWRQLEGFEEGATITVFDGDDSYLDKSFKKYQDAVEFYNNLPSVIELDWLLSHFK